MSESTLPIRGALSLSLQGEAPTQEDYVLPASGMGIFALADGFGGALPGLSAARTACESVKAFLEKGVNRDSTLPFVLRTYYSLAGNVLFNSVIHANRKVLKLNRKKSIHERGGASVIAGYLDGDLLALANVGACSAWLFRRGECRELVLPRSYARLSDPLSQEPTEDKSAPLTALGLAEDLEPEIAEYRLKPGDWVMFHSDGLPSSIRCAIQEIQSSGERDAARLLEKARETIEKTRTTDNISVFLTIF